MKKNYLLILCFCIACFSCFQLKSNAQCGVTGSIDLQGYTSADVTFNANENLSSNWSIYQRQWDINGVNAGNQGSLNHFMAGGMSEVCLTSWATDTVTGDSCF